MGIVATFYTGDKWRRQLQLTRGGAPFEIPTGSTVRAVCVHNTTGEKSEIVECDEADFEADWPVSLVLVEFGSLITENVRTGESYFQLRIDDEPTTWEFPGILIKRGSLIT
jgi:hypothetical protein